MSFLVIFIIKCN